MLSFMQAIQDYLRYGHNPAHYTPDYLRGKAIRLAKRRKANKAAAKSRAKNRSA